ncbi:MAG: 16S rRNA methyltransferase [Treponema sp.]|jgi:16S rRNA (cytosine1407-C5)-methyltransferase|nr:16S rRNA methyltransferase [Treponema sp.]
MLKRPYFLDRASILASESLRIPDKGEILDACAAPGGKTLVIASRMGKEVTLLANELSGNRRRRLVNTLNEHADDELRGRITVSGFDAAALAGKKSEHCRFAAVLLDAPCSGEAHLLRSESALKQWTPARPRFLSKRQWALLSAAFLLLAPGGSLVYATCAINGEENDGVVFRLLKKYGDLAVLDRPGFTEGEETETGRVILPDRENGIGPMFVARFLKKR